MSVLPSYARFDLENFTEGVPDPSVRRTEMERGPARQEIINSDVWVVLKGNIKFFNSEDATSFFNWYMDDIKRVRFFEMRHPRTGMMIQARFIGGKIGELAPITGRFGMSQRSVELEYLRYGA